MSLHVLSPTHTPSTTQVRSLAEMQALVAPAPPAAGQQQPQQQPQPHQHVVDARPAGRFKGVDPEPRPGLRQGHMPGAHNLPFTQVGGRVCFWGEGAAQRSDSAFGRWVASCACRLALP